MRELVYRPVCDAAGDFLPWLLELRNQSGAYVIRSRPGWLAGPQCLYVGESHTGSLSKTLRRHFHRWRDDPERRHHTYDRHAVEVAVRLTPPPAAVGAQNRLIRRLRPKDNGNGFGERPF